MVFDFLLVFAATLLLSSPSSFSFLFPDSIVLQNDVCVSNDAKCVSSPSTRSIVTENVDWMQKKKNALSSQSLREARDATICLISTSHSNLQTRIAISHPRTLPMPFSNQVCFLLVFAPFVCADQITPRPLSANQVKPSGWMDRCRQGSPLIKRKGPSERKEERTFLLPGFMSSWALL